MDAFRFLQKIDYTDDPDSCWEWTANKNNAGYGQFRDPGLKRNVSAHRYAYEHLVGPIPDGMYLDHYRMNPGPRQAPCARSCCNPNHLEIVDCDENARRRFHPDSTTALKKVAGYLETLLKKHSGAAIAREIGVYPTTIYKWKTGKGAPTPEQVARLAEMCGEPQC